MLGVQFRCNNPYQLTSASNSLLNRVKDNDSDDDNDRDDVYNVDDDDSGSSNKQKIVREKERLLSIA